MQKPIYISADPHLREKTQKGANSGLMLSDALLQGWATGSTGTHGGAAPLPPQQGLPVNCKYENIYIYSQEDMATSAGN